MNIFVTDPRTTGPVTITHRNPRNSIDIPYNINHPVIDWIDKVMIALAFVKRNSSGKMVFSQTLYPYIISDISYTIHSSTIESWLPAEYLHSKGLLSKLSNNRTDQWWTTVVGARLSNVGDSMALGNSAFSFYLTLPPTSSMTSGAKTVRYMWNLCDSPWRKSSFE